MPKYTEWVTLNEGYLSYDGMTAIRRGVASSLNMLLRSDLANNESLYQLWLKLRRCMDYWNDNNM